MLQGVLRMSSLVSRGLQLLINDKHFRRFFDDGKQHKIVFPLIAGRLLCGRAGNDGFERRSIDRPDAGCSDFDQMAVRIAKIDALAAQFPGALLFHRDSVLRQPCLPIRQL